MEQVTSSITYKLDDLYKKITFLMVKMKSLHHICRHVAKYFFKTILIEKGLKIAPQNR